jgi:hypothetical protein
MIVWGGAAATDLDTGGRYDPVSDQWTATATVGAPSPRLGHSAVWTGDEMVVWGGDTSLAGSGDALATGGRYDPGSDTWTPTSLLGAPSPRTHQKAVWTGSFMVVWGGIGWTVPSSGGRYVVGNPDGDADGVADACDCAPGNPAVFAVPGEIAGLAFAADKTTLTWASASGGPSTVHDGMVGDLAGLPVSDGAGTACMGPGRARRRSLTRACRRRDGALVSRARAERVRGGHARCRQRRHRACVERLSLGSDPFY